MKYAAININVDSVGEEMNFSYRGIDPAFTAASDRLLSFSRRFRFPYTFFIVGKDLDSSIHRQAVRRWSREGHEIGNHSWTHHNNLGALTREEIVREVKKTHERLVAVTKKKPVGFISPGWSHSEKLLSVLEKIGYEYDCSLFPSWTMMPAILKLFMNRWKDQRKWRILQRPDVLTNFFGRTTPFRYRRLAELPLPVGRFRLPCYHTMGFIWGWNMQRRVLQECLARHECFYYLMHPVDVLDTHDVPLGLSQRIERLEVPVSEKLARAQEMIDLILKSGRRIITMKDLARRTVTPFVASVV